MLRIKYIGRVVIVASLVAVMLTQPVLATPSSSELKEEQDAIKKQAKELEDKLSVTIAEINSLKSQIEKTEVDLKKAGEELEEAEELENDQYEAMKLRIRFMYEESTSTRVVERVLEAQNITDMLNQVEYISEVHTYDRDMLDQYIAVKEAVIEKHEVFEEKLDELEEANVEVTKQQNELAVLLSNKQNEIEALDSKIAAAVQVEIEEAERKRKEEEAAAAARAAAEAVRQEALNQQNTSSSNSTENSTSNNSTTGSSTNSSTSSNSSATATGQDIVNYALQFVGNKYVYGGTSLTNGIDCSGFTQAIYRAFGYSISRTSSSQRSDGVGVSYSSAQPGDIICYSGHVGIYMGNGMIVHASNSKAYPAGGIKTDSATYSTIIAVRRIL